MLCNLDFLLDKFLKIPIINSAKRTNVRIQHLLQMYFLHIGVVFVYK